MKKAIGQILSGNMLSKALGLLREILMAKFFGTGDINGAYRIAQTGTLVPINFMTSDSLNSALIPLYKKYLVENEQLALTFKFCMFVFFTAISFLLLFVLYFHSEYWVKVMAPGLGEQSFSMAVHLLKLMALCCPFYFISALLNYISMAHGDYKPMSMRASVQNIGMVIGVLCAFYYDNFLYLAWGFTGSYVFFCVWIFFRARKSSVLILPKVIRLSEVKLVMNSFWITLRPLLLLPLILQGNITLERALASLINIDVVSALDYAKFITDTVVFILSVPIAFAGLSEWPSQSLDIIRKKISKLYCWLALLVINMSFFIFYYARDLVIFLFMRGQFNETSVIVTTHIVQGMAIGLWAQVVGYIFIKALSSHLRNKQVLVVMAIALLSNALVNLASYKYWGAFGLGLGNSIYGIVMMLLSSWYLKISNVLLPTILKVFSGIILYVLLCYSIGDVFSHFNTSVARLIAHGVVFFVFAFVWAMLFPLYRSGVVSLITKKGLR